MQQIRKIKNSLFEVKSVYALTVIAMLLALRIVLGIFANATLAFFGNSVKLSASFLPIAVTGVMFGPVPAAFVGAMGDIISFIINPTGGPYFPGFTISGLLTGIIYGMAFYKNRVTIPRVVIAWFVNMLLVETFLAAYWLFVLYNTDYITWLTARFISQAVKCIPEILLILVAGKVASKFKVPTRIKNRI